MQILFLASMYAIDVFHETLYIDTKKKQLDQFSKYIIKSLLLNYKIKLFKKKKQDGKLYIYIYMLFDEIKENASKETLASSSDKSEETI